MITSKLTTKAQTTIPQPVRVALGLQAGDEILYAIEDGRAVLTKRQPRPAALQSGQDDPFAKFSEWESQADAEAYATL